MTDLNWGPSGLLPAIAQSAMTGEIRMVAYANAEALSETLATGKAHFWSRSRGRLWCKGEESGNHLEIERVVTDCDADVLLYLVRPRGPSCHTGAETCLFQRLDEAEAEVASTQGFPLLPRLEAHLRDRAMATDGTSYTRKLIEAGPGKIAEKVREEGGELAEALCHEEDTRVVSEAADVMYHLLVGLQARGLGFAAVAEELNRRFGTSGLLEKASRKR